MMMKESTGTIAERFLADYERLFGASGDGATDALSGLRTNAIAHFARTGIPAKSEDWKYTNVSPLLSSPGLAVSEGAAGKLPALPGLDGWVAVCVNGRFRPELSRLPDLQGVLVSGLADAAAANPEIAERQLGKFADIEDEPLVALNAAFAVDGVYVRVGDGVELGSPVHVVSVIVTDRPVFVNTRHLIVVGEKARATIIEHDVVSASGRCFTNAVVEGHVGRQSLLEHYRLQEKDGLDHVDSTYVRQEEDSEYKSCTVATGDGIVRDNITVTVAGERCRTHLLGMSLASGSGHIDHHTLVDHAEPNCRSDELYKCILTGKAVSVFRGKLLVRKDAQKTEAYQSNRNLLLSEDATANALPQLEIYADDVKCSHGATTGLLDQEALFYLRARGIPKSVARKMLIGAFVDEVVDEIDDEWLKSRFRTILGRFLEEATL